MMIGLDCKVSCPSHHVRVIGRRKLQRSEHFDIADRRLWREAGSHCRHFGQPMHRLQDIQPATYNGLDNGQRLLGIGFPGGVFKQPFENHARIEHDDHGSSAARALRTSSLVIDPRLTRALLNWRKSSSRLSWSCRSRTARRNNSAMMELLFLSPKALSNAALTSSGTLKLTVAIGRLHC